MHRLIDALTSRAGDALVGYHVKLRDTAGVFATLYSDSDSTPIATVSGFADTMVTDANGMFSCYVDDGTYDIEAYVAGATTPLQIIAAVPMYTGTAFAVESAETARDAAAASAVAAASSSSTASAFADVATAQAVSATASAASAVNAPGTSATSTTSLAIGTGSKSLTIQTGKAYSVGQFVTVANTTTPANYMLGQITAYDSGTGALTVNVTKVGGSGTLAAWTIGLTGPAGADGGGSGTVTSVAVSGGTTGLTTSGGPITTTGTVTLAGTLAVANGGTGSTSAANARTALGTAASGLATASGITMATARLLGRTTASTGAIEEISVGTGLAMAAGVLTATATGGATYSKATANQATTSATAVDITNLAFTPAANTTYEFEAVMIVKAASSVVFKVGIAWPTGLTTGHALIVQTSSMTLNDASFATNSTGGVEVTSAATYLSGTINLGTDTYRLIRVTGLVDAGATPSGAFKLQFASNGTITATIKAGSFIKYSAI